MMIIINDYSRNNNDDDDSICIIIEILAYPYIPSSLISFGTPSLRLLAHPGWVCTLTLTASIGARAISAKNSALALAAR